MEFQTLEELYAVMGAFLCLCAVSPFVVFFLIRFLIRSIETGRPATSRAAPYGAEFQCPNCGGYDLIPINSDRHGTKLFLKGRRTAYCNICKYRFYANELPETPIRPNQQLVQMGRRREEERRRRWD